MYHPPNTPPDTLLDLVEVVSGWALEYHRLLVFKDISVHAHDAAFSQTKDLVLSMVALGLSQLVPSPTHQAGHTLHLIWGAVRMVDLVVADPVPWSDHFPLKTW